MHVIFPETNTNGLVVSYCDVYALRFFNSITVNRLTILVDYCLLLKKPSIDILIQCGENIKRSRKKAILTQEQLSEMLDMDVSQFGKIERGQTNITVTTLYRISLALGVDIDSLLKIEV